MTDEVSFTTAQHFVRDVPVPFDIQVSRSWMQITVIEADIILSGLHGKGYHCYQCLVQESVVLGSANAILCKAALPMMAAQTLRHIPMMPLVLLLLHLNCVHMHGLAHVVIQRATLCCCSALKLWSFSAPSQQVVQQEHQSDSPVPRPASSENFANPG